MQFKNKVVVITGASSGIGRALAYEFASHGARIVMGARSEEKLQQIAADLKSRNTEVAYAPTDVTQEADCQRLIETAVTRFGGVDILICNAGISMRALFDEVDLNVLRRLMDVNFWGTVYCTKYALPYIQQSRGSIVGVSSVAGIHGLPGRTGYSASKFAIEGYCEALRLELQDFGIKVVVIEPGDFSTNFTATRKCVDAPEARQAYPSYDRSMQSIEKDERSGMKPEALARKICRIVSAKNPRYTYIIASPLQKLSVLAKTLLPPRLFAWVLSLYYRL